MLRPAWIANGPRNGVVHVLFSMSLPSLTTAEAHGCRRVNANKLGPALSLTGAASPGPATGPSGQPLLDRPGIPHRGTTELVIRRGEIARLHGSPTPVDLRATVVRPRGVVGDTQPFSQIVQGPVRSLALRPRLRRRRHDDILRHAKGSREDETPWRWHQPSTRTEPGTISRPPSRATARSASATRVAAPSGSAPPVTRSRIVTSRPGLTGATYVGVAALRPFVRP